MNLSPQSNCRCIQQGNRNVQERFNSGEKRQVRTKERCNQYILPWQVRALVRENFCYCGFNSRSCQLICFYLQFLHINLTKYSNEWWCNTLYQFFLGQNLAFIVIFDSLGSLVLESDPPKITGYGYFYRV